MWVKDNTCEEVIKESWAGLDDANLVRNLLRKITSCQDNLQTWNRVTFGHVRATLAKKLKELSCAEEAGLYSTDPALIEKLRDYIQLLKVKEETMWKQGSYIEWLKEGD